MGVGASLYMYDVVVKSSRSLSYLLISSCSVVPIQYIARQLSVEVAKYECAARVSVSYYIW